MSIQKVAMISGSSRGIGLVIATKLSRRGYLRPLGARDPSTFAGRNRLIPIPCIRYSGEDLLIAIGGYDESGFSASRTRRLGMAIRHVSANDERFRYLSVRLGRRLATG